MSVILAIEYIVAQLDRYVDGKNVTKSMYGADQAYDFFKWLRIRVSPVNDSVVIKTFDRSETNSYALSWGRIHHSMMKKQGKKLTQKGKLMMKWDIHQRASKDSSLKLAEEIISFLEKKIPVLAHGKKTNEDIRASKVTPWRLTYWANSLARGMGTEVRTIDPIDDPNVGRPDQGHVIKFNNDVKLYFKLNSHSKVGSVTHAVIKNKFFKIQKKYSSVKEFLVDNGIPVKVVSTAKDAYDLKARLMVKGISYYFRLIKDPTVEGGYQIVGRNQNGPGEILIQAPDTILQLLDKEHVAKDARTSRVLQFPIPPIDKMIAAYEPLVVAARKDGVR